MVSSFNRVGTDARVWADNFFFFPHTLKHLLLFDDSDDTKLHVAALKDGILTH